MGGDISDLRAFAVEITRDADLLKAVVEASRQRSPEVAALPWEETERHVRALVTAAAAAFSDGRSLSEHELAMAARLGGDRARQGVPIAALLDGFQAGRAVLVRQLVDRLQRAGIGADTLLNAFLELDGLITALEHQLTHAHRTTELELTRTASETRALLLRELLLDGVSTVDARRLEQQRLDPGARYHCLVSGEHDARAAQELANGLATDGGIFGLVNGFLVGLATRLPTATSTGTTLVVASPAVALTEVSAYYPLCCAARDTGLRQELRGLRMLTDLAVTTALHNASALGRLVTETLLCRLRVDDPFHLELAHTAMTHLERGGRLDDTAAAMHVHPNTVKYRLRRLREISGQPLELPGLTLHEAVRWWWALRTWLDLARSGR
jgi:hypothetical protein